MTIQAGSPIPDVTLACKNQLGIQQVNLRELTGGKKVVLFAVPGAFTPTCSDNHLPGVLERVGEMKGLGVDVVACTSVNDAFVMEAWGKDRGVGENIMMLADGNGELAGALGLVLDGTGFGMGQRSERYAMIVEDGTITYLAVEAPRALEVSTGEAIVAALSADRGPQ